MVDKIQVLVIAVGVLIVLFPFAVPFFTLVNKDMSPCRLFGLQVFTVAVVLLGIIVAYVGFASNEGEE